MIRRAAAAVLLALTCWVVSSWAAEIHPVPPGNVRIQGRWGLHVAAVNQDGQLSVNCETGCSGGPGGGGGPVDQSGIWTIQGAHQAGSWAVAAYQSGAWALTAHQGGSWAVSATQSGVWSVAHVSSALHIAGSVPVWAFQSGAWSVQAHQVGTWTIQPGNTANTTPWLVTAVHVSAAIHVGGGQIQIISSTANRQAAFVSHFGALAVTCFTNAGVPESCAGSGSSSDTVNVFHQSTIRHISSVTHIQSVGRLGVDAHQGGSWTVAATQSGAWNLSAAQSGGWIVTAAHQAGIWNIGHISGALHVVGISNVSTASPMACHSSTAINLTADGVIAGANSGNRIFICGILIISTLAESVSIVEGSGSACGTGTTAIIGGTAGAIPLAANGGFSAVQPFPWVSSRTLGNAVCLIKSGIGTVAGVITYRGAP